MKRIMLVLAILLALGAATAAAQTRVGVSLGFGVPRPHVSGVVVIGRPYPHWGRWRYYHPPRPLVAVRSEVVILPARPLVLYRRPYHRHHRRYRW